MSRTKGQEMRRLQKKLVPVNIIVCIICVIASLSLYLMPIIKIDLGAIVGADAVKEIVTKVAIDKVNSFLNDAVGGDGSQEGEQPPADSGENTKNPANPDGGENTETPANPENGENNETPDETENKEAVRVKRTGEEVSGGENPDENAPTEGGNTEGGNEENGTPTEGGSTAEGGNTSGEGSNSGSSEVSLKDILGKIKVDELVTPIVDEIMSAIKADISVSAKNSLSVFLAQNKAEKLLDELFFNEANGFIPQIQNTLIKGFGGAFKAAGQQLQAAVVSAVVMPAIKDNLPKEYADLVVEEELQETVKNLDNAKSAKEASDTIIDYIDSLAEKSEDIDELTPEKRADIEKQITDMYNKTVEQTRDDEGNDNFSLEAMITVIASEAMDGVGEGFNLSDLIAGLGSGSGNGDDNGGEENPANPENPEEAKAALAKILLFSRIRLAEDEVTGDVPPATEEAPAGDNNGEQAGKEKKVYTSYQEMGEGIAASFIGDDLAETVKTMIMDMVGGKDDVFGLYGYIWMGIAFFIALWLILFLFSFFHMFARNKRFMMWYVKLFCFTPCLIFFVIPLLIMPLLTTALPALCNMVPQLGAIIPADLYGTIMETITGTLGGALGMEFTAEQATGLVSAVLSAFKSMTWVSGACYLVLWLVSILWAFPIKHKIRKLKKS